MRKSASKCELNVSTHQLASTMVSIKSINYGSLFFSKKTVDFGRGFFVDRDLGYIATNKHLVSHYNFQSVKVIFSDGFEVDAKKVAVDLKNDLAILRIDNYTIFQREINFSFSNKTLDHGDCVFMLRFIDVSNYNILSGRVISNNFLDGHYDSQSLLSSINTVPGESGSPIFDSSGDIVGITYAARGDMSVALDNRYINNILSKNYLDKDIFSAGFGIRYCRFDRDGDLLEISRFNNGDKNYKICINNVFGVNNQTSIWPGDEIISVNKFKPKDKFEFDELVSSSNGNLDLTVKRAGKEISFEVRAFNLNKLSLQKVIYFNKSFIFEADNHLAKIFGITQGTVLITNPHKNSLIDRIEINELVSVNDLQITNLKSFVKFLPKILDRGMQKYLLKTVGEHLGFNDAPSYAREFKIHKINNSDDHISFLHYENHDWERFDGAEIMHCSNTCDSLLEPEDYDLCNISCHWQGDWQPYL